MNWFIRPILGDHCNFDWDRLPLVVQMPSFGHDCLNQLRKELGYLVLYLLIPDDHCNLEASCDANRAALILVAGCSQWAQLTMLPRCTKVQWSRRTRAVFTPRRHILYLDSLGMPAPDLLQSRRLVCQRNVCHVASLSMPIMVNDGEEALPLKSFVMQAHFVARLLVSLAWRLSEFVSKEDPALSGEAFPSMSCDSCLP